MRLVDLEPQWLEKDGVRIGFIFWAPVSKLARWRMTCFFKPTPHDVQYDAIVALVGEEGELRTQTCNPASGWTCTPEPSVASFDSLSITPSLDGGNASWHGHITNGEIVGGI